jgi:hypothetical protein
MRTASPLKGLLILWLLQVMDLHVLSLVCRFCILVASLVVKNHVTRLNGHHFAAQGTPDILTITGDGFACIISCLQILYYGSPFLYFQKFRYPRPEIIDFLGIDKKLRSDSTLSFTQV